MNILYICADRGIPIRGYKGAAIHVRSMTDAFARAGHSVTIVSPRPGPDDGPAPSAEIVHIPLPHRGKDARDEALSGDQQSQAYNDLLLPAVLDLLKQRDFDMIYERYSLWSDIGARLARQTGLPFVLEVNAPLVDEAARYRCLSDIESAGCIETTQFKTAYAVAVVSQSLRDYVVRRGVPLRRVHVLPNGVNSMQFHPAVRGGQVRGKYGLNGRLIIGFSGRARPWHDLDTLFQAVAQLRQEDSRYHLLLVGQMPDDVTAQLSRLNLSQATTLTGPIPHDQVPFHLAAMNVAVSSHLPLLDFYFSPLKLFEYLACGVPTVAADLGQPAHIIQHGETGYLYRPGDGSSLAEQIRKLVEDPAKTRQIAWQGAITVLKAHTWDKNAAVVAAWVQPRPDFTMLAGSETAIEMPILDRKLRQRLYRATRPDLAGPLLARRLPVFKKKGAARFKRIMAIESLKYKPGRRCVLGYRLDGRSLETNLSTQVKLIGKVFRDERGLRLHKLQKMLWHNGFGADTTDGITVPNSLAYVPEMRMQVQDWVQGQTLNELATNTDLAPLMPLVAKGLAKLHNLPVPIPVNGDGPLEMRTYLIQDECENLERFTAKLAVERPYAMQTVFSLRDALLDWAERLPPLMTVAPIHRDFYYSQVLYNLGQLTLIDFDLFALGDPAIDVANFIAHLHFLGMDKLSDFHALQEEGALFLESYGRFHLIDAAFQERFAFFKAATYFRLLNVVAPRPGLAHLFAPLLTHTTMALEAA